MIIKSKNSLFSEIMVAAFLRDGKFIVHDFEVDEFLRKNHADIMSDENRLKDLCLVFGILSHFTKSKKSSYYLSEYQIYHILIQEYYEYWKIWCSLNFKLMPMDINISIEQSPSNTEMTEIFNKYQEGLIVRFKSYVEGMKSYSHPEHNTYLSYCPQIEEFMKSLESQTSSL